jgi:protein-S-isoprenylcysteine O-methyltransferase Ste14
MNKPGEVVADDLRKTASRGISTGGRVIVTGPYAYVRNPMAVAGLGQGFSVALALRSPEVAAYVVIGMLIWNYFVRPEEERYLQSVFGVDFEHYRSQVRCWIPRGRAFSRRAPRA